MYTYNTIAWLLLYFVWYRGTANVWRFFSR